MPHTLVDTNVLLDVLDEGGAWESWSTKALTEVADDGHLIVNQVIYAEVSVNFGDIGELDFALQALDLVRGDMPWSAAFLAGKAYRDYRKRGGTRTAPLPDFFVGAHAAVSKLRLLTRDATRYRTYFPTVDLIAP